MNAVDKIIKSNDIASIIALSILFSNTLNIRLSINFRINNGLYRERAYFYDGIELLQFIWPLLFFHGNFLNLNTPEN